MSKRIRAHLRSNVVGYIALFCFAMSGTAAALPGTDTVDSGDIIDREVKTADISNSNGVRTADVRNDNLAGGGLLGVDIADGALTGADVANGSVTGADVANESLNGNHIADINSLGPPEVGGLNGGDIADGTLTGSDVDEATLNGLGAEDGFAGLCDPQTATFIDCDGAVTTTLERAMNVLVIATSHFDAFNADPPVVGNCRLEQNDVAVSNNHPIGELDSDGDTANTVWQGGMNLVQVQTLAAGTYTFEVACNETDADIEFRSVRVVAIELSPES